jgi:phospholipid N-methyltransferase
MIYISNALRDLKTLETITMQPHHRRYLEWMRYQEKRMLDGNVPQLNYQAVKELFGDLHARSRFVADVPVLTARERLLHRVGPQIGRILAHEVDPLEIMFRQDNLMDHFYAESSVLGNTKALLDKLLGAIGHSSTNLKVIEIGAGTGSTTLPVLNALSPRSSSDDNENAVSRILSYTYTDISAGFFEHAKAKFELWENIMEYSTLDIESSPVAQGFEEGVYDVVIASNVSQRRFIPSFLVLTQDF